MSFKSALHAHWPADAGPADDSYNVGYNPQYTLTVKVPTGKTPSGQPFTASVWVLLSRHVTRKKVDRDAGPVAVSDGSMAHTTSKTAAAAVQEEVDDQFLTLHVFARRNGHRVYYPHDAKYRGKVSRSHKL